MLFHGFLHGLSLPSISSSFRSLLDTSGSHLSLLFFPPVIRIPGRIPSTSSSASLVPFRASSESPALSQISPGSHTWLPPESSILICSPSCFSSMSDSSLTLPSCGVARTADRRTSGLLPDAPDLRPCPEIPEVSLSSFGSVYNNYPIWQSLIFGPPWVYPWLKYVHSTATSPLLPSVAQPAAARPKSN